MYSYKFAPSSQPKDHNPIRSAFPASLRGSNFDVTQSANVTENPTKMGFDGSFPQSLSSRRVESHGLDGSVFLHRNPEVTESRPFISAAGTSFRLHDVSTDIGLNSRAHTSSSTSYSKKLDRAATQEPELAFGEEDESKKLRFLGPVEAEFRRLTSENAKQRDCITDLESELKAKNEENMAISREFKQTSERYRDALGRAVKSHSALKSELDDWKLSLESQRHFLSEAKATNDSLVALRDDAKIGLRNLEAMAIVDDNGQLVLTAESRETVYELRSELSKTQQVADLLRDKLHAMGGDLAEARARISQLEELNVTDRNQTEMIALKISQSSDRMVEVTQYLREQKAESIQATTKTYEMEQQLEHAQARLQEAQSVMTSMKEEITAREELYEEQGAKLRTLRHTIDFQEGNMKAVEARAKRTEEELVQALNRNHELQGRLEEARGLEKNLTQQVSRLLSESDKASERFQTVERQLAEVRASETSFASDLATTVTERNALSNKLKSLGDVKREADLHREKYAECQVSLKVLQERFDDQCVTFAASKESIGELQERLHEVERKSTETLDETKSQLALAQGRNMELHARLDRLEKDLDDRAVSLQALQNDVSRREGALQALLESERSGRNEALRKAQEATATIESLRTELAQKDNHVEDMTKRLSAAEAPSAVHEREVSALRMRISELEEAEKKLTDRAMTISHRYENSDLNDNEKALVALLMQKARAIHDREMVEKANEIKRRDNIIKQNAARITQLESVVNDRIYDEPWPTTSENGTHEQGNSISVDVTRPLGPPPDHQPEIRGGGHETGPSTTATHTASHGDAGNANASRSSGRSTAGYFATLCRQGSDDIADVDDERASVATTGKRVMFADEVEDGASRPPTRRKYGKSGVEDQNVAPALGVGSKKRVSRRR